jgi:hypothetical protein
LNKGNGERILPCRSLEPERREERKPGSGDDGCAQDGPSVDAARI